MTLRIKTLTSVLALSKLTLLILLSIADVQPALAERKTTFFHTDALGSVIAASNEQGALLWRKEYAPYGEQIDATQDSEALAYTGKQHDEVTGLTYFGARYYDPEIGRFLSIDPVGFVESNPMSFNRYLYVNDNPYKYVDPDGEFLNFAAKFVLDVGVNIAFNYVTTGGLGIGSALKESAVGILNPAKTMAKVGKLAASLTKTAKRLPDSAIVCRGGTCTAERFTQGSGVSVDGAGRLQGVSVNSAPGRTADQLTVDIPNKQVGVSTVGDVRRAGGDVIPSPTGGNPSHCTLCGITPRQAEELFTPTVPNPNR